MGSEWTRYELRMSLSRYHIRMILDFNYFREHIIRWTRRHDESFFFHLISIRRIEFKSMSMSLKNGIIRSWRYLFLVDPFSERIITNDTRIKAETHISSFCCQILLIGHNMNNIISSLWSEFLTRCILYTKYISSKFDCHNLRSEADTQERNVIFTCVLCRQDHTINSACSKSPWNTYSVKSVQKRYSSFFNILSFDKFNFYTLLKGKTSST